MRRLSHLLESGGLAAVAALALRLPRRRALALGRALGQLLLALGVRRAVVLDNLRQAFPEWEEARVAATARRCYEVWGQALVDYARIPRLRDPAAWHEVMEAPEGMEHVTAARREGKGAILMSGHFGVFEFLGAAAAAAGNPVHFVVQPQSNAWVDAKLAERRRLLGVGVLRRGAELRELRRLLAANACVAMAADQDARGRGVFVPFFGRPASTPTGPAALSLRTGAPIVMGFAVRGPDGRHRSTVLPPIEYAPTGDFDADVLALTRRHTEILEQWVRRHPEHWYWLHRRWKSEPQAQGGPVAAARRPGVRAGAALALAAAVTLVQPGREAVPAAAAPAPVPATEESARPERRDATTFGGAGSSLMPLAETRVARLVEDLVIRRTPGGWGVEAVGVFQAGAAPEVVPIALPDFEAAADTAGGHFTLAGVRLLVDGVEVSPSVEPPPLAKDLPGLGGIGRLFVWRVRFGSEERKVLRLRYRVGSSGTERGEDLLFYYLNTGTPWRGPSGRVNARVELGDLTSADLVAGWLRPTRFGVTDTSVTWLLEGEEPEEDLVVAVAGRRDPLAAFADRERGPLSLGRPELDEWLARSTPGEWRFWRAFLRARLGETPADSALAARLGTEPWFEARPPGRLRKASEAERSLLEALDRRLTDWEGHRIPAAAGP